MSSQCVSPNRCASDGLTCPRPDCDWNFWKDETTAALQRIADLEKALGALLSMVDDSDYLPSDSEWAAIVAARQVMGISMPADRIERLVGGTSWVADDAYPEDTRRG